MNDDSQNGNSAISRRGLLNATLGISAVSSVVGIEPLHAQTNAPMSRAGGPFASMRDYIAALEKAGLVVRIPRADQDEFEAAALFYRMRDEHGMRGAPVLIFDQVRIDGEWINGPLLVNESGHLDAECIAFGLAPVSEWPLSRVPYNSYRKARTHVEKMVADNGGEYPTIPTTEIAASEARCKEVILTGKNIDLTRFAFIKSNPGDAGRYINTGNVFTRLPRYGVNMGVYRCHLRGPREIALNSEPGQTGYRHLMAARARGEKTANVSIALTCDPYVWMVAGSKMAYSGAGFVDELTIAGGLAGRSLEVVRSETNDLMVPAWAEMIIEGEVPLDDLRPEGPYGEMVGYQGPRKDEVFWVNVTAVTHRRNPWLMNNFTGAQAGTLMAAGHARPFLQLKQAQPCVVDIFSDTRAVGLTCVSIKKEQPGQGMVVAQHVAEANFFSKIVVAVNEDVDVTDHEQILAAMGARWQPFGSTKIYESQPALPLDPSATRTGRGSKIAIDATRKWPEEGGPADFPALNRTLLEEGAPDAFARTDKKWGKLVHNWRPG